MPIFASQTVKKDKMKHNILFIVYILTLLSFAPVRAERIDTLLHFNFADLQIDTLTAPDGNVYTKLSYPGCGEGEDVGMPSLPITYVDIILPTYAEDISINYNSLGNNTLYSLGHDLYPIQPGLPYVYPLRDESFYALDSTRIQSDLSYPSEQVLIKANVLHKDNRRSITLAIYPVSYMHAQKQICYYEDIQIGISYINSSDNKSDMRGEKSYQASGLPYYQYCVITSRALKDSFTRLIAWQRQKGINAGIVCIEDILDNNILNLTQDEYSNNAEDPGPFSVRHAGMLRQYLREAANSIYQSNRTKYVLLGGDYNIIPTRYAKRNDVIASAYNSDMLIPSDWYYSELSSSWYRGNDTHEYTDSLDSEADLNVGRILCTTPEDVENYTNKLLRYEMIPGNGDLSYLKKSIYTQADQGQESQDANRVADNDSLIFTTRTIIEEYPNYYDADPTYPTGSETISALNNHYAYSSFYSHGNPYFIKTKTRWVNNDYNPYDARTNAITSRQGIDTLSIMDIESESANGFDNLTNKDYPMFTYSASCTSVPFDYSNEYYNLPTDEPNIGKSLTTGGDYGSVVYIGNTRLGLVQWSSILQKRLNLNLYDYLAGEALNLAKNWYNYNHTLKYGQYLLLSTNLIGSPNVKMWGEIPKSFNAVLDEEEQTIYANNDINDAEIIIDDISGQSSQSQVFSNFDFSVDGYFSGLYLNSSLITLLGNNCLPQILPLFIYEPSMEGIRYLYTKDVKCEGCWGETVTFKDNSDYTFESNGTFRMIKNVKVENGAKLKIIPSNINF